MRLTVLGSSGTYAGPGGACSGYLVEGSGTVWIDAGSGTLANLQCHVPFDVLDAVVLSHEHPDHWTDLEGFFNVCRFVTGREGVPVYAPAGLKEKTYQDTAPFLDWHEICDGDRLEVRGMIFTFSRTDHGPETLAMRLDDGGRSLGYSADTGPAWSLEALGEGIHLALCEATFQRPHEGSAQHLSARQAGQSAREAGVGRLVLTHVWPTLDSEHSRSEGAEAFGSDVDVARPGDGYEV